ncbi:MAG: DUF3071 domain-containing protein, partial [Geodermatophilaceae bacterium]|nr:DUF3071 domain-containing protein [Geodermatophilaceae bacterium]
ARQARVRLADGTPAGPLGEFMTEKLSLLDVDHRTAIWDARRLPDGSWEIMVSWTAGNRHGLTRWWYDVTARTVTPADADTSAFAERSRSGQSAARAVRPADAPAAERPESDPTGAPVGAPESRKKASTPRPSPVGEPPERRAEQEQPPLIPLDPGPAPPAQDGERDTRARIPSWEDIVFGVRRKR